LSGPIVGWIEEGNEFVDGSMFTFVHAGSHSWRASGLKGHNRIAQGNALGLVVEGADRPEGAKQTTASRRPNSFISPFQGS
jgi:hypothetical protein